MYDTSGCGESMKQFLSITLGVWHPLKQATLLIIRMFKTLFIAPLFHFLHPGELFFQKPSFTQGTYLLSLIRLAYPSFKDNLRDIIKDQAVVFEMRVVAQNLFDLCEFFIPLVRVTANIVVSWCRGLGRCSEHMKVETH